MIRVPLGIGITCPVKPTKAVLELLLLVVFCLEVGSEMLGSEMFGSKIKKRTLQVIMQGTFRLMVCIKIIKVLCRGPQFFHRKDITNIERVVKAIQMFAVTTTQTKLKNMRSGIRNFGINCTEQTLSTIYQISA